MAKISEETLNNWRLPPSDSEEGKLANSERMVKEAISDSDELKDFNIRVFGQGSYANDTNVRLDSDIDINVCLSDYFFFKLPDDKSKADMGYTDIEYDYSQYKNAVERALVAKFGRSDVIRNDKCITVKANTNRVEADVVPTWEYHRHENNGGKAIGTKFISDKGVPIINYPLQHIQNGKAKNDQTQKRFKRLTRIFKRIENQMVEDGVQVSDNITSFLIECLVWNVPNYIFNDHETWTKRLSESIVFLYTKLKGGAECKEWGEVSELLYLFNPGRKWSEEDVKTFLAQTYNYLEF